MPNPGQQAALLQAAWQAGGIDPAGLGYIEAHGTGTPLGDPIEVRGITEALGDRSGWCGLGSVKTNLGHLEAAAGLAGLLKTILALQHRHLPASLHFERLNPEIDLGGGVLSVVDREMTWPEPTGGGLRLAGVSSFGSGGTNAHAVVAGTPHQPPHRPGRNCPPTGRSSLYSPPVRFRSSRPMPDVSPTGFGPLPAAPCRLPSSPGCSRPGGRRWRSGLPSWQQVAKH